MLEGGFSLFRYFLLFLIFLTFLHLSGRNLQHLGRFIGESVPNINENDR